MTFIAADARVTAGIAFLDRNKSCCAPVCGLGNKKISANWKTDIRLSRLNMDNKYDCVLGQLLGTAGYFSALTKLGISDDQAVDLGFQSGRGKADNYVSSEALDAAWKAALGQVKPKVNGLIETVIEGEVYRSERSYADPVRVIRGVTVAGVWSWIIEPVELNSKGEYVSTLGEDEDLPGRYRVRSDAFVIENYREMDVKFVKGGFYKAGGKIFFAESAEKLWRLQAEEGAMYASPKYFEQTYGKLEVLKSANGSPLTEAFDN